MMSSKQSGQRKWFQKWFLGLKNGRSAEPPRSDDRNVELETPQSTQPPDGIEPPPAGGEETQNILTAPLLSTLAEMEVDNRIWIKKEKNKKFKEALETWEAKDKLFAGRMDKKKKQSNSLRNEIYQLVGFYLVFQGVLLTAVALANLLTCDTWWSVFFLSLLACIVTIGGVIQKFYSVIALEKTIANEGFTRQVLHESLLDAVEASIAGSIKYVLKNLVLFRSVLFCN